MVDPKSANRTEDIRRHNHYPGLKEAVHKSHFDTRPCCRCLPISDDDILRDILTDPSEIRSDDLQLAHNRRNLHPSACAILTTRPNVVHAAEIRPVVS
jgi:hypothetical protein